VNRHCLRSLALSGLIGSSTYVPEVCWAEESTARADTELIFHCAGQASEGRSLPPFASGAEVKFEVSASFGEGAIVALIDPATNAVRQPLYDAESTSGRLRLGDGGEATIVWTRMSGIDGALVGEAITSDGDVLALSIDPASGATTGRPFVLFAASPPSLFRGACVAPPRR
jgi:hypothetical protein